MIPTEILQAHNNIFSLPVRFGLNCAVDVYRTLTVQCEGVGGVIDGSTVACVYDSGPIQEECEYIQQLLHVLTVIQNSCNNMVTNIYRSDYRYGTLCVLCEEYALQAKSPIRCMILANHKGKERGWKDNTGHVRKF